MAETRVPSGWDQERTGRLVAMWADGQSAKQIAVELGDVSRNACIGKVHRLGLATRATPNRKPIVRKRSIEARVRRAERERALRIVERAKRAEAMPAPKPADPLPPTPAETRATLRKQRTQRCTIFELDNSTCRYPLWNDDDREKFYCGAIALSELPYCEKCAARCYNGRPQKPQLEFRAK